jgi:hypothetical protein
MKKNNLVLGAMITVLLVLTSACSQKKEPEWVSIFNGKDLTGWSAKFTGQEYGKNYLDTFQVKDGKLIVSYDAYDKFDLNFGHLFYDKKLSRYKLRLDYRFVGELTEGAPHWAFKNSGIKFHTPLPSVLPLEQRLLTAVEAQILGGDNKTERFTGNACTAGTHIEINKKLITEHCTNSNYPAISDNSWVTMEIEVQGSEKAIHKINGQVVLEYSAPQYDDTDKFATELMEKGHSRIISEGYIALQAEGHPIEFRNIELLNLSE